MANNTLFDRCKVNTNIEEDVFVGIQKKDRQYLVSFPLGYHTSSDEKGLRKDILSLLAVLAKYTGRQDSEIRTGVLREEFVDVPVLAYLYVIKDFLERGYYRERETYFKNGKKGKINWSRTIKTQRPVIQENEAYYLDFIVKRNAINENELITLVHKFCVYESFDKFGWLFTSFMPDKPRIGLNHKMMMAVVNSKLQNTFNDKNKRLFKNMRLILASIGDESSSEFKYGTYRFEYVWEKLIDHVFGIEEKSRYFPRTTWNLTGKSPHNNACLEPDSIMKYKDKVYVLDAKYYKYGWSGVPGHLPESTSINKQITYGEYAAKAEEDAGSDNKPIVYNAFIMPFDSKGKKFPTDQPVYYIGTATSDWKRGKMNMNRLSGCLWM